MNKKRSDLPAFFELFKAKLSEKNLSFGKDSGPEILFAMPFTLLESGLKMASGTEINIAAQNMHWSDSGAFTGEISAGMLLDLGVKHVLIGHSERRQYFAEIDQTVAKKVKQALLHDIQPIVCVGETLEEREQGRTEDIVRHQVQWIYRELDSFPQELLENIVIAYEPVWAIGTGKASSSEDAQKVHEMIRSQLSTMIHHDYSRKIRILYGGSASPKNVDELLRCPDIDGGLVGGASLNPDEFAIMVQAANRVG